LQLLDAQEKDYFEQEYFEERGYFEEQDFALYEREREQLVRPWIYLPNESAEAIY
jgi:hypothetical protein